jgi:hypothetical protein
MVLHYLEYLLDNLNILKKYIDELKKFMNQWFYGIFTIICKFIFYFKQIFFH